MGESRFYHVCTNGLRKSPMFADQADFVSGMNDIPSCAISSGVNVYCFCLMDNHVHFILKGSGESVLAFIRQYKRLRSRALRRQNNGFESLRDGEVSMKLIDDPEYLLVAMAYVMRNPVAAGLQVMPGAYPWSSASLYFGEMTFMRNVMRCAGELTVRERRKLLRTRVDYPSSYQILSDGLVFPGSYVEYQKVEAMYGSPKRLLYYLSRNQDIEQELEYNVIPRARYRDSDLAASLSALTREKYGKREYHRLKIEEKIVIASLLRHRYKAPLSQVARISALDLDLLRSLKI